MNNLKIVMAKKNVTVKELSERTKQTGSRAIAEQTISTLRNGKGNPTLETMKRIAEALDVKVSELL